jgi:hypothetical protein
VSDPSALYATTPYREWLRLLLLCVSLEDAEVKQNVRSEVEARSPPSAVRVGSDIVVYMPGIHMFWDTSSARVSRLFLADRCAFHLFQTVNVGRRRVSGVSTRHARVRVVPLASRSAGGGCKSASLSGRLARLLSLRNRPLPSSAFLCLPRPYPEAPPPPGGRAGAHSLLHAVPSADLAPCPSCNFICKTCTTLCTLSCFRSMVFWRVSRLVWTNVDLVE